MDVTPLVPEDAKVIRSYGAGGFQVSKERHDGALLVLPDLVIGWDRALVSDLDAAALDPLLETGRPIDIVLMGTGARFDWVPADLRAAWRDRGLRVDPMDTGAACRTYNVLMAEGRRVAAALMPVP